MPDFVNCRNCVAWREPLYEAERDLCPKDSKVCRRYANKRYITSGDDGCCEGVPKKGVPKGRE